MRAFDRLSASGPPRNVRRSRPLAHGIFELKTQAACASSTSSTKAAWSSAARPCPSPSSGASPWRSSAPPAHGALSQRQAPRRPADRGGPV